MKLQDAIFNWLQIKVVADARPEDQAAQDTVVFFEQILEEDHQVQHACIAIADATQVHIQYRHEGKTKKLMFDREASEQLLSALQSNPKYTL